MSKHEVYRRSVLERIVETGRSVTDEEVEVSPDGRYEVRQEYYACVPNGDASVRVVRVFRREEEREVAAVVLDDEHFFHAWIARGGKAYFLCAECLEGGQTVVDLEEGTVASAVTEGDEFIWCQFSLSPDGETLAVCGCYWACPYMVSLYDFREPMSLPLRRLRQFWLPRNDARFLGWDDERTFTVRVEETGVERRFSLDEPSSDADFKL